MVESVTYYPKSTSSIKVLRLSEKNNNIVITVYYLFKKKLISQKTKKLFNLTAKNFIDKESEYHEDYYHKEEKPFEFHTHIMLEEKKLKPFLKYLFKENNLKLYHLDRLFGPIKNQKFTDGSIMSTKYYIEEKNIKKNSRI